LLVLNNSLLGLREILPKYLNGLVLYLHTLCIYGYIWANINPKGFVILTINPDDIVYSKICI